MEELGYDRNVVEEHWQGNGTGERLFTLDSQDDGLGNIIHYWVLSLFDDTLYITFLTANLLSK